VSLPYLGMAMVREAMTEMGVEEENGDSYNDAG
jgi:hypothetical protein